MKKKQVFFFILLLLCYLPSISTLSSESANKEIEVMSGEILFTPTKNIDPTKPMVALTFDDGPTRIYTTQILDCLKDNQAHATFFVLASRVSSMPDLLERMILEGNEVGNHTFSHKQLTKLDEVSMDNEISKANETIANIINQQPRLLRPPYGEYNETVLHHIGNMRIVRWTIDSEDWKSKDTATIVNKVMQEVKDKDIILLHDLYQTSADAACLLIPQLIENGYQLVTVSDLYQFTSE